MAGEIGLDAAEASDILAGGAYADEVREREEFFQRQGITAVPAIIIAFSVGSAECSAPAAGV